MPSNPPPPDYEAEYRKAYKANVAACMRNPESPKFDRKIHSFCELFEFSPEEVVEQIRTNRIVAAKFALDPKKQNIYEKIAANYIASLPEVEAFKNLGSNKLRVSGGGVYTPAELRKSGGHASAKTIDFSWDYRGIEFFASHKYTKEEGGSQGSAYNDLLSFIQACNPSVKPKRVFFAIADGPFYNGQNGQVGKSRLENLKTKANRASVFACTIAELPSLLEAATPR